jgi:hypothetical protein
VIVAPRRGFYNIGESADSPTVPIGKNLRSTYGIVVGEEDEGADEIIDEETIDEELIDKEEIDEEDIWIPYQEFRAPANRLATTTTTLNTSRSSRWQAYISIPSEAHAFIHPTPKEVLYYMLESIEEFHSDVYGSLLHRSRDSGLDFLSLLLPEALRVLSSGNYSRDK